MKFLDQKYLHPVSDLVQRFDPAVRQAIVVDHPFEVAERHSVVDHPFEVAEGEPVVVDHPFQIAEQHSVDLPFEVVEQHLAVVDDSAVFPQVAPSICACVHNAFSCCTGEHIDAGRTGMHRVFPRCGYANAELIHS